MVESSVERSFVCRTASFVNAISIPDIWNHRITCKECQENTSQRNWNRQEIAVPFNSFLFGLPQSLVENFGEFFPCLVTWVRSNNAQVSMTKPFHFVVRLYHMYQATSRWKIFMTFCMATRPSGCL